MYDKIIQLCKKNKTISYLACSIKYIKLEMKNKNILLFI